MTQNKITYAKAYYRYSSDNQREESIEAQMRAVRDYAERNGYVILDEFIDRKTTGTTDLRPEFQRMMSDSAKKDYSILLVHKLDRFARNRNDSIVNKISLKRNGVSVVSVTEPLDGSPESIILEAVLEAMAEYYSLNLAREVEKGKTQNALKCQHVGGKPPLGYDVTKEKQYVINEREAEAVRLIFRWVSNGKSYGDIIAELNNLGYKTKVGNPFGKNTLYSILRNEKYYGLYTYNRSTPKDTNGRRNSHKQKDRDEWIAVEDGIPAIISREEFDAVQAIMSKRMQKRTHSHAKENYILTGKMICGVCGGSYVGSKRRVKTNSSYAAYGCNKRYRTTSLGCDNKELSKAYIESWVVERLSEYVFSDKYALRITEEYNQYIQSRNQSYNAQRDVHLSRLRTLDKDIDRTVTLLIKTTSDALTDKLQQLESEKAQLKFTLDDLERDNRQKEFTAEEIKIVLARIRELLKAGTLETIKSVVDKFVSKIMVNPDGIVVHFNFFPEFTIKPEAWTENDRPMHERTEDAQEQSIPCNHQQLSKKADEIGGAGGS